MIIRADTSQFPTNLCQAHRGSHGSVAMAYPYTLNDTRPAPTHTTNTSLLNAFKRANAKLLDRSEAPLAGGLIG